MSKKLPKVLKPKQPSEQKGLLLCNLTIFRVGANPKVGQNIFLTFSYVFFFSNAHEALNFKFLIKVRISYLESTHKDYTRISEYNLMRNNPQQRSLVSSATYILTLQSRWPVLQLVGLVCYSDPMSSSLMFISMYYWTSDFDIRGWVLLNQLANNTSVWVCKKH